MDKYEYKLKLDQMRSLTAENKYKEAVEIADTINWNKIKNVNSLVKAGEIYENAGRLEESKEILLMAYDRSPIGRMIIYRLAKVAVKMKNFDEAKDYYQEFVEIAPHDNLKYVLKYQICKAQGANIESLIKILEELKEQEYTEEWAYELACLYHKAGLSDKCVDACDELVLWFGEGPYVERALELKMLYQPLSRQQEEKYRQFRQKKEGVVEVRPDDELDSGEIVNEPVQIPDVKLSPERFNTQNLQEELQRSMQQIMEATERETVDDSMDNIKKLVEEIPYLQLPKEEQGQVEYQEEQDRIATDEEIDNSLKLNFKEMLAEDYDGQISLYVPDHGVKDPQISGQMSIEEVLAEWEKTKRAAQVALQEAQQRKLECAKARALHEAEDIMERLADIIPKLDSGLTPKDLLEKQYLEGTEMEDDKAAEMVANMNQLLQEEIDRISTENAKIDERLAEAGAVGDMMEGAAAGVKVSAPHGEQLQTAAPEQATAEEPQLQSIEQLEPVDKFQEGLEQQLQEEMRPEQILKTEQELQMNADLQRALEAQAEQEIKSDTKNEVPEVKPAEPEEELPEITLPEDMKPESEREEEQEVLPDIEPPEEESSFSAITSLSDELRSIFTYFVPIKGMESQLCQAMTGAARHLLEGKNASSGNMIIQGSSGSGKTVLATSMVKALQKKTGKPSGRVGKIEASVLNQKDVAGMLKKVAGGCLIIEKAGSISRETAVRLALLLESDTSGLFVIIEDTHKGIKKALSKDEGFASRFSEKINIPIFTSDELVTFAKSYANELGYAIDEMGVLALYNRISNIQNYDRATTLTEVKDIVDRAIAKSEKGGIKKVFGIITSRRYDEEDYIILREKDFGV